jgi:hypothetical protein
VGGVASQGGLFAGRQSTFQVHSTSSGHELAALGSWVADAFGAELYFMKSRNATIGSHTVVQSGDEIGALYFGGSDGTDFEVGASIEVFVDGTPGNNDMPGRFSFHTTPDGSAARAERMRIDNAGLCYFPSIGSSGVAGTVAHFNTGTSPANRLFIMTSSLRYKKNIGDVSDDRANAALDMRVIEFNSNIPTDDQTIRCVGMGAEWVAEADPALANFGYRPEDWMADKNGAWHLRDGAKLVPDAVRYEQVNLLRTEALKRRCAELERRIIILEGKTNETH